MARIARRTRVSDGKPTYIVKWRTPDGKDRSKGGFSTKRAAEAWATTVEYNADRGAVFDRRSGAVTFREAAAAWLASRHDLKPRTRDGHASLLAARKARTSAADLSIDATFGGWPLDKITRAYVSVWVEGLTSAGLRPSTVRNNFFVVRMVLAQAVLDGRLPSNPADGVRLPSARSGGAAPAGRADAAQFLTAAQVDALTAATPWPYSALVHLAAWSGLRAGELAGLQVGDVALPSPVANPNAPARPGTLRVERTVIYTPSGVAYDTPKTRRSRRRVPLPPHTVAVLRAYLAGHPRRDDPAAPLFPAFVLERDRRPGLRDADADGKRVALAGAAALAALSVKAAGDRLALDWSGPFNHGALYRSVYRPALLRARRLSPEAGVPAALRFHDLRHTYASLCVAAGLPALAIAGFMGHASVTTTLNIYAHLFDDDHSAAMGALSRLTG